jgi:hypothetical protein
LAGGLQAAEHELDLVCIVQVVEGTARFLPKSAYVFLVFTSKVLVAAFGPQELINRLIASVGPHIQHVVYLGDLRDFLEKDFQEFLLFELQGFDL